MMFLSPDKIGAPCVGFVLKQTASGTLTAVLQSGLGEDEVQEALQGLAHRSDISHVDVIAYPAAPGRPGRHRYDNTRMARMLLPLALKPNINSIRLGSEGLAHTVRGAVTGLVVEAVRATVGKEVNVLGTPVKLKDVIKPGDLIAKFIVGDAISSQDLDDTCRVLRAVRTMTNIPYALGHAVTQAARYIRQARRQREKDAKASSTTQPNSSIDHTSTCSEPKDDQSTGQGIPEHFLGRQRRCYVCKAVYNLPKSQKKLDKAWLQYSNMCHACAVYNLEKRLQRVDMRGKYAVVTGGRVKIGYHVVLKLLRDGCTVIATTRFPRNAASRYQEEPDYNTFKDRLKLFPMDLKSISSMYALINYVKTTFPHLDVLVNNAAQTIRRPPEFFDHMLPLENMPINTLPASLRTVLATDTKPHHIITCSATDTESRHIITCSATDTEPHHIITCSATDTEPHHIITCSATDNEPRHIITCSVTDTEPQHIITCSATDNEPHHIITCSVTQPVDHMDIKSAESCVTVQNTTRTTKRPLHTHHLEEKMSLLTKKHKASRDTDALRTLDSTRNTDTDLEDNGKRKVSDSGNYIQSNPMSVDETISHEPSPSAIVLSTCFPPGQLDEDGQQLDLRPENSWVLGLERVPLDELLEVIAINSVAPFVLTQQLKPWLDRSPHSRRFVVNVSAMEGQFSRVNKSAFHPHTNMAKAALNMLTRTAGVGFRDSGVYMTAVDTGWVTDERPFGQARHEQMKGFQLPLDSVDGAARIYDPVIRGYKQSETKPDSAVFLKDYKPHPW